VVSLLGEIPTILRPGTLSMDALRAVAGGLTIFAASNAEGAPLPSPGMLDRHYAPRAKLSLFDPDAPAAAEPAERAAPERRVAVLVLRAERPPPGELVRMPNDPAAYAARLYATLHQLDEEGYEMVWVERVPPEDAWDGVRDRLRRAAQSA
jgi:L-threonylcarbamoyladenylate synthase